MKVNRDPGGGFPYDPDFDYRPFQVRKDLDGTLLGTHEASRHLRLRSSQAVLDMVATGKLPALLGHQPVNKRRRIPLWAVRGLAKCRLDPGSASSGQSSPARQDGGPDSAPGAQTTATPADDDGERLRREVSRLRAENSDLRFAWAAMREARQLLDAADDDREAALGHLRDAERRQSEAARKSARAARLQADALAVNVMPADGADITS